MKIVDMPLGKFGRITQGKWTGRIGFRTESCFFVVDDPSIDWLNTASIFVEVLDDYEFTLRG